MTKVLVNLLMEDGTQALMDSFMLRNTTVDLPAIVERFLVKFMEHYESKVEVERMMTQGIIMEPVSWEEEPRPTMVDGSIQSANNPAPFQVDMTSQINDALAGRNQEPLLIQKSSGWHLTPTTAEDLQARIDQGLASPVYPRAGASSRLMRQKTNSATADGSSTPLDPSRGSAPNAEDATSTETDH